MMKFIDDFVEFLCAIIGINPKWILGDSDPTKQFGDSFRQDLVWDFESKCLNGIPFGASIDEFKPFGAADHYEKSSLSSELHSFTYGRSGLEVSLTENDDGEMEFDFFSVLTGADSWTSKPGVNISINGLILNPGNFLINSTTRPEILDELFRGIEVDIDDDVDEHIRVYVFDSIEYEFEFQSKGGELKRINIFPEAEI